VTDRRLPRRDPAPLRTVHLDGEALADIVQDLLARGASVQMVARGGSMSPWIRDGDFLTILPRTTGQEPRRGDVVAFRRRGGERLVVHRLVSRAPEGWIARGDRCDAPDGFIADAALLGTVDQAKCGARRRLLPQGFLGLILSSASRLALQLRDRVRILG
jgi:hypothetical protein